MAFSKNLEELIEAALADGVITDKERAVLHKKAQQEGVDLDEIDVVIDGRLQQMQNEIDKAKQKVRKCPSCGEIIPAMTAVCPNCGQVIDTSNPDNKALKKYMDQLEGELVTLKEKGASKFNNKSRARLESLVRQGKSLYGDNKKIDYLISEVEASIEEFERAHKNTKIRKYAIIALAVFALIGYWGYGKWQIYQQEAAVAKKAAIAEPIAQHQCDSLCSIIASLPCASEANYKSVEQKLLSIIWIDIPDDKSNYKKQFLIKKRAKAKEIDGIYGAINGIAWDSSKPDEIEDPNNINH